MTNRSPGKNEVLEGPSRLQVQDRDADGPSIEDFTQSARTIL
jgi:hypothetical protein